LHGAVQFNDDHAFNKALLKFEELVKKYYGKPINFVLHRNSELGLEKQYFEYMAQGKAVDYGIVSPAHMSTFSKARRSSTRPSCSATSAHWNKVLDADILKPIADEVAQKAEVMLIGYAGGGTRNIFVNKPVKNLAEIKGLKVRVQGAPIWSKTFAAVGMSADGDRLQRGLQRDPEQRHRGRRERGGRCRSDEVLRGRAAPGDDAARDHDPADLLLGQDLRQAAGKDLQARDRQGRQGSRRLRAPGRVVAKTRPSSTCWRRPASSSACRSPTATR
jgi:hypothetical protein